MLYEVITQRLQVTHELAPRQHAGMNARVQCFYPPIEHLREACIVRHLGYVDSVV